MKLLFQRKNEGIFQLSLTEIAFMLIFILLLLFGLMYFNLAKEHYRQQATLAKYRQSLDNYEQNQKVVADAIQLLKIQNVNPDEIISQLKAMIESKSEVELLKAKLQDQENLLTSLTEILGSDLSKEELNERLTELSLFNEQILQAAQNSGVDPKNLDALSDYLKQALQLNKLVESALPQDLEQTQKDALIQDLVTKLNDPNTKDNLNLQGQVAYLRKRLESQGGRDLPPCWANPETGNIDYLFRMDIFPNGIKVTPIWATHRAEEASKIPNVDKLSGKLLPRSQFQQLVQPIRKLTDEMQCRHYVHMKNNVTDLKTFNSMRYAIEHVFYKLEVR